MCICICADVCMCQCMDAYMSVYGCRCLSEKDKDTSEMTQHALRHQTRAIDAKGSIQPVRNKTSTGQPGHCDLRSEPRSGTHDEHHSPAIADYHTEKREIRAECATRQSTPRSCLCRFYYASVRSLVPAGKWLLKMADGPSGCTAPCRAWAVSARSSAAARDVCSTGE